MEKKAITLQQLEEALRDLSRWIRDKLADYMEEPAAEGKSGYILTTNGTGGRSWEEPAAVGLVGPQGPQGEPGPQGEKGEPGEPGPVAGNNLLDNWYFGNPVNQRGKTSYTATGYTIDRWAASSGSVTVAVGADSIEVSVSSGTWQINQVIEFPSRLNGQTVTLSAWIESGHNVVLSLKNVTTNVKYEQTFSPPSGVISLTYDIAEDFAQDSDTVRFSVFITQATSEAASAALKAAKLELGDTQTLAHQDANDNWQLNEIPNYSEELLKCIQSKADSRDPYANKVIATTEKLCNPNLLDNWYFVNPVNQRGETSVSGYSASEPYFFDRWRRAGYAAATLTLSGGVTFDNSAVTAGSSGIMQVLEKTLPGGTYTLSVYLASCNGEGYIGVHDSEGAVIKSTVLTTTGVHSMTVVSNSIKQVRILARASSTVKVIAVKLELGDTQTLAHQDADGNWQLNEMPSYGLQLENCRRYYQRIRTYGTYALPLAFGHMASTTVGRVALVLPTPLRDVPTMTASGVKFAVKSASTNVNLSATPTVFLALGNVIHLSLTSPSSLNTNSVITLCYYGADSDTHYIELSADL